MNRFTDLIGRSPIHPLAFITGKLAFLFCGLFFLIKIKKPDSMLYDSWTTSMFGIVLFSAGFCMIVVALLHLGESAAVGLPDRETTLKTHGLYRFSRNPVYLSGFLMCAGSCLYAIHPLNCLLFAVAVLIHHRIILKEEVYLENKFGQAWLDYKKSVPRYLKIL